MELMKLRLTAKDIAFIDDKLNFCFNSFPESREIKADDALLLTVVCSSLVDRELLKHTILQTYPKLKISVTVAECREVVPVSGKLEKALAATLSRDAIDIIVARAKCMAYTGVTTLTPRSAPPPLKSRMPDKGVKWKTVPDDQFEVIQDFAFMLSRRLHHPPSKEEIIAAWERSSIMKMLGNPGQFESAIARIAHYVGLDWKPCLS